MLYSFIGLIVLAVIAVVFLATHAPLGKSPDKLQQETYEELDNYQDGKFINVSQSETNISFSEGLSMLRESIFSSEPDREPDAELPVADIDWDTVANGEDSLTWFGHSTYLLSIDGKKLFIDPMLGSRASPVSFAGSERYSDDWLGVIDDLPTLDAVLFTHDHYDHLDYESIQALKDKVPHFFVPLGVSAHLTSWGVEPDRITELNWWDELQFEGLTLALTPSKHFSGRGLFNRNATLWGGWVVLGQQTRFYTSGDGGYDSHFKDIGEAYGPFDIALMEGGQYDERWESSHMTPEQAVQAHIDVQGETMMLVHWAAFTLAFHGWSEPAERALPEAERLDVDLITPKIGETLELGELRSYSSTQWWKE
ncbi:MBL fold metallo-hydrolase [Planococcus sp. ISL-109]|uniref:MBL fold metallo-hydrolase n=1 Tax=Planococcus sp. ISL-109 TaxID=2819166 RepID=UPI001BEAEDC8|nr:MBL fold metallo-hydrolase [Planococcus sp. ISL-109]MBT2582808.1 MBL fold metallo-hydrolase [Planococcus sp. ISL-109]